MFVTNNRIYFITTIVPAENDFSSYSIHTYYVYIQPLNYYQEYY